MKTRTIIVASSALFIVAVGGAVLYGRSQLPLIEVGVGYGARVACACRYIGNRAIGDCYKDFEPGMELITLRDDPATKTVTAFVPGLASRSATFDPVLGCQPEKFKG
jgi:hypothetical protein